MTAGAETKAFFTKPDARDTFRALGSKIPMLLSPPREDVFSPSNKISERVNIAAAARLPYTADMIFLEARLLRLPVRLRSVRGFGS